MHLHLSRKQLLDLLAKLDCGQLGEVTSRTILVHDSKHPDVTVRVTALEDSELTAEFVGHLASNRAS